MVDDAPPNLSLACGSSIDDEITKLDSQLDALQERRHVEKMAFAFGRQLIRDQLQEFANLSAQADYLASGLRDLHSVGLRRRLAAWVLVWATLQMNLAHRRAANEGTETDRVILPAILPLLGQRARINWVERAFLDQKTPYLRVSEKKASHRDTRTGSRMRDGVFDGCTAGSKEPVPLVWPRFQP